MNPQPSNPEDKKLRDLLRESHGAPELPPRFQEAVWSRIARSEVPPAETTSWFERVVTALLRPQVVAVTLGLFLTAGVIAGLQQGRAQASLESRARYLTAVNPFEKR